MVTFQIFCRSVSEARAQVFGYGIFFFKEKNRYFCSMEHNKYLSMLSRFVRVYICAFW